MNDGKLNVLGGVVTLGGDVVPAEQPRARIAKGEIAVRYSARPDVGREFLEVDVPNGWDDVRPIYNRVLIYENKRFTFTGWNSDSLKAYFARPFDTDPAFAKIRSCQNIHPTT